MRLGIRGKLLAGFGAVLVLLAIVAGFGIMKLQQANGTLHQITQTDMPIQDALADQREAMRTIQRDLRQGVLVTGDEENRKWQASLRDAVTVFETAQKSIDSMTYLPEGKAKVAAIAKAWAAWTPTRTKVYDLAAKDQNAEATAILLGSENAKAAADVNTAIKQFGDFRDARVDELVADADAAGKQAIQLLLAVTVLAAIVGLGIAFFLARSIAAGVQAVQVTLTSLAERCATALAAALDAMAQNDLTVMVTPVTPPIEKFSTDEIGDTARMTNLLRDRIVAMVGSYEQARAGLRETVGQVQEAANGVAGTSEQLGQAASQTSGVVQQVTQAIQNVAAGAQDTSRSAQTSNQAVEQLSQAIDDIARGASEQARQVQDVSTTATQMAAGVEQVASNAHSVAAASEQTKASAEQGARAVRETVAGMTEIKHVVATAADKVEELGRLGEKIGAVVETIDDIAEQTNLLALNAAIEAARAGEHGRGFAVVADEVRKLAERSQRETKAIADLIRDVQTGTREAVSAMVEGSAKVEVGATKADEAGTALAEILRAVEATVGQVTRIAAAAQEMATGAHGVVESMNGISAVVEESSASTEEMAAQAGQVTASIASIAAVSEENSAASEEVSASAEEMSAQVEEMNAQAEELSATAQQLKDLAGRFTLDDASGPATFAARRHGSDWQPAGHDRPRRAARAS